jgi:predicted enzyme related to lactoylglutathione lyase
MSVSASAAHGRFLWYELMTSDVAGARAFYGAVIGWGQSSMPSAAMAGGQYDMFTNAAGMVAGVVNAAEFSGGDTPPYWLAYFGTADTDATVARAVDLGGAVIAPPMDIPGIGRFAILADPLGAVFALLTPSGDEMPPVDTHAPGAFSWHEVYTTDLERAWAFYTDLFGWVKTGSMDMGPMGEYRMYGLTADKSMGGFSHTPPGDPSPPHWVYYVTVSDIAASLEQVKAGGGRVLMGPMEVPGNDTIAICMDPQGAVFAVYQSGAARSS